MKIYHPEIEVTAESSEEAFTQVWAPRGWERLDDTVAAVGETLGVNVSSLDQLTKSQLHEYGASAGLAVSGSMTKDELIQAIQSGNMAAQPETTFDPGEPDEPEETDLDAMTKQQLVDLAQSRGIADATMSKSKPDLIDLILSSES